MGVVFISLNVMTGMGEYNILASPFEPVRQTLENTTWKHEEIQNNQLYIIHIYSANNRENSTGDNRVKCGFQYFYN